MKNDEQPGARYERDGRQLRRVRWLGVGLLALALGLGRWGPHQQRQEAVPTSGYVFRQAGWLVRQATARQAPGRPPAYRPPDTSCLWILAYRAGRAHLLLSNNRGRSWQVRDLNLPPSRVQSLALGWGTSFRGLAIGDSGQAWVLRYLHHLNTGLLV